jgi:hypothetical protein
MKLIKFRIRGLEEMADSGWLTAGSGATLLSPDKGRGASAVLQALQHINPAYEELVERKVPGGLSVIRQKGYNRRVLPAKRTAALAVFAADIGLVQDLSAIDPDLLETDRIEVGRRLDYSRWLNFVEIPSSSRWGEIVVPMQALWQRLLDKQPPQTLPSAAPPFADLTLSERIRGDVAETLMHWLTGVEELIDAEYATTISSCRQAVGRSGRFAEAKRLVADRLPRFVSLGPDDTLHPLYDIDDLAHPALHRASPFVGLLAGLWQKTLPAGSQSGRQRQLQRDLDESRAHLNHLLTDATMLPRFFIEKGSIRVTHPALHNRSTTRGMVHIAAVLVLSQALYQRLPILLLDQFEHYIKPPQQDDLFEYIKNVGEICQIFCTAAGTYAAGWSGWSGLLHLGENQSNF